MEKIRLTEYEMSDLYSAVYFAVDSPYFPNHIKENPNFLSMIKKVNWHMSSKTTPSPYEEENGREN